MFEAWHDISNEPTVNNRFTHKELTLAIGIFVAILVAFTFWSTRPGNDKFRRAAHTMVPIRFPDVKGTIQKSANIIPSRIPPGQK